MQPGPFSSNLTELLRTHAEEYSGVYDSAQRRFTQVNAAGRHLLGYPSEEVLRADRAGW